LCGADFTIAAVAPVRNEFRLMGAVAGIGMMRRSGSLLDRHKDNPQRKVFEAAMAMRDR
jgi:hypothetical protein